MQLILIILSILLMICFAFFNVIVTFLSNFCHFFHLSFDLSSFSCFLSDFLNLIRFPTFFFSFSVFSLSSFKVSVITQIRLIYSDFEYLTSIFDYSLFISMFLSASHNHKAYLYLRLSLSLSQLI